MWRIASVNRIHLHGIRMIEIWFSICFTKFRTKNSFHSAVDTLSEIFMKKIVQKIKIKATHFPFLRKVK